MVVKPLGLPPGSVRALLLLALGARAVFVLKDTGTLEPWYFATVLICGVAYFSARSASNAHRHMVPGGEEKKGGHPLGLPAGTVRLLFLALAGYAAWLWFRTDEAKNADTSVFWIFGACVVGLITRIIVTKMRPEDAGARFADHLLALISVLAGIGLVVIAASGNEADVANWVQPMLAAIVVHYFATR